MRKTVHTLQWIVLLLSAPFSFTAHAERPYCPEGKELRCLDFEHKIVKRSAVCFEPQQCDQGGFICRTEMDELAREHKALLGRYNELATKHNQLIGAYETAGEEKEALRRCISAATSLAEARNCI